jgi:sterol desaturase/sphingolipid hydroxylase (fatty acid hydroxylase superfamily)
MEWMIAWLEVAPLWQAVGVLLLENVIVLLVALAFGHWLVLRWADHRVSLPPPPLARLEIAVTVSTVLLNTVTTLVGLFLWRAGIIRFRTDVGLWAWLDILVLLLIMDLAMYLLHRLAHHPWIFPLMHRMHHEYDRPRPLTLFILNPVENLAFGALWLVVICVYPASWFGMSVYLVLNVLFGTVGHLGVEPVPTAWARIPVLRWIAGSTFHARHHQDLASNFGFYTLIWDRLFGTLRPDYWETFGQVPAWVADDNQSASGPCDTPEK